MADVIPLLMYIKEPANRIKMLTKSVDVSHLETRMYEMLIMDLNNVRPALRSFS